MAVPLAPRALTWLLTLLLALVALRLGGLAGRWRRGDLAWTRLLLPSLVLLEGLGLLLSAASPWMLKLRLGTVLGLELLLVVLAVRTWRSLPATLGAWPEDRLAAAFAAFLPPRLSRLLALELVMLVSAVRYLGGGFREAEPPGFTHHRESALRGILPALPLLVPGDFLLVKVLSGGLAPWLRWALHGSTAYAVLWLFGYYATLKARPHQIREGQVHLHQGLLKSVAFPASLVQSAAPLPDFDDDWARHAHLKGVPKLVAKGNALLELKLTEPVRVTGLLGPGRPAHRLVVSVDDPAAFRAALGAACA